MFEIFQYNFFQNALIWGCLFALLSSILWVFIIMRKEANIAHSITNFIFLGIAFSLFLDGNYYIYGCIFAILASILIYSIEETRLITKESNKEIIAQIWMAWGIFIISMMGNVQLDLNNLLFWNILLTSSFDIVLIWFLCILWYILFFFFGRNFLAINMSEDIARIQWIHSSVYRFIFILFLAISIWVSIKIFGILLIGAFLVIPANTAKIISKWIKQIFIFTIIISLFSVLIWLPISHYLDTSSSATIVLLLVWIFVSNIGINILKN